MIGAMTDSPHDTATTEPDHTGQPAAPSDQAAQPTQPAAPSDPAALALMPLLTPEGWALLGSLPPYDEAEALSLTESLREEGHSPELVAAALSQQRLRGRAEAKFGPFATAMLFTPDGLEQATRLAVAARHAARYSAAGASRVADLGCGIGGDAMALAGLGLAVLAVERDEATAALATINLMPFEQARVRCADALGIDLEAEGVDAVFADPARRAGGRRITDPEQWSPALSELLALRESVPALGLKVAPGLDHAAIPDDAHAQWVSVDGAVVEAGLWFGPLAPEGPGRSALCLRTGGADGASAEAGGTGAVSASVLRDESGAAPSSQPAPRDWSRRSPRARRPSGPQGAPPAPCPHRSRERPSCPENGTAGSIRSDRAEPTRCDAPGIPSTRPTPLAAADTPRPRPRIAEGTRIRIGTHSIRS